MRFLLRADSPGGHVRSRMSRWRTSPSALVLGYLLAGTATTGLMSQTPTPISASHPLGWKNPTIASVVGTIVPGAGQFYAGEHLRGASILLATAGAAGMGVLGYYAADAETGEARQRSIALEVVGFGVAAIGWIGSAVDAPRAAHRANVRHGLEHALFSARIRPVLATGPNRTNRVGLAID